jgi:hypothetical protein
MGQQLRYRLTERQRIELEEASAAWKAMTRCDRPARKAVQLLLEKHGIRLSRATIAELFPHDAGE